MTSIMDLLSDQVKILLRQQTEYLEVLTLQHEESTKYKDMLNGAETLMYILEETELSKTGTKNFLKQLDRDQLKHAITSAKELLKEKESAGKVQLYYVDGGNENGWFYDKKLAEEYFPVAAKESVENGYPEVRFGSTMVYVEELEEYLGKELAEEVRNSL